jgi:molybdenum cofactor synthesis domain-containing protein
MRPFQRTIPLAEAQAIIAAAVTTVDRTEYVPLLLASGRVLAEAIVAEADVPPFSRAAMDGYAVRAVDTAGATVQSPRTLRNIEQVFTGQMPRETVGPGECSEVATGAPMPTGADAVVMVEETSKAANPNPTGSDSGRIQILAIAREGQNIGRQGADIQRGQEVLRPGTLLNASRVGAIAALGKTTVQVYAKPTVAILSTGNEIVDPGQPLQPGQIYDINSFTLASVVTEHGGVPVTYRTAADTIEDLSRAVDACLEQDLLVFSGGSSVGERDLVLDVLRAKGEVLFHGIAVKPGKPTAFGRVRGKLAFGMPGYPTSCLSNAYILLVPVLRRMARLPAPPPRAVSLPLGARVTSVPGRHQFYSVTVTDGRVMPAFKASGDITSMSQADGYIEIETDTEVVEAGTIVDVRLF